MAHGWHGDADRNHGSAGRGLHPDFLYWRLDMELADMTTEDTPPAALIEHWKRRVEEFKVKLEADPDNKIASFFLACYEGYLAHFSKEAEK